MASRTRREGVGGEQLGPGGKTPPTVSAQKQPRQCWGVGCPGGWPRRLGPVTTARGRVTVLRSWLGRAV